MSRIPDFKAPQVKVPPVLSDLVYDLRDRRLLPFVALVIVAVLAVPFLLSDSRSEPDRGAAPAPSAVASGSGEAGARLTVVRTDHGLREPRKRLGHLVPKDPFEQQYTGPSGGGGQVSQTSTSSTAIPTETGSAAGGGSPTAVSTPPASTPPAEAPSTGGSSGSPPITLFTFAIDVKVVRIEGGGEARRAPEATTKEHVMPPATLPGKKTEVLTYIGIGPKTENPLFLVSTEVTAVFGEAKCVSGSGSCQLIELEPGFPVTFVYGPNDVRYKVNVLKVQPVAAGHL
jgi:hypothetical protein